MRNLSSSAKKALSIVLTLGLIISMFSCMSGLSVFAVDNTPSDKAAVTPVVKEEVKEETVATATTANAAAVSRPNLEEGDEHTHCQCGQAQEGHVNMGDHKTYSARTFSSAVTQSNATTMLAGGKVAYLTEDITLTATRTISGEFHLCLNGHKIIVTGAGIAFQFGGNTSTSSLVKKTDICDCVGTGGIYTLGNSNQANGSVFRLYQVDTAGSTSGHYAIVRVFGGNFGIEYDVNGNGTIDSGEYSTTPSSGATLYVTENNRLLLYGGTFHGATDKNYGKCNWGGILNVRKSGIVTTFPHAELDGGRAAKNGGLISGEDSSTIRIYGGTLKNGTAPLGALIASHNNVSANGTVYILGGTLNGGNASTGGSVIYSNAKSVDINNNGYEAMKMYGGTAANGGTMYFEGNVAATVYNCNTITGGTVTGTGGTVYATGNATFTLLDGTISGGTATGNGGTIYACGNATVDIQGGTVNGGTANAGGSVNLEEASAFTMSGGTLNPGTLTAANKIGGTLRMVGSGTAAISGGTINGSATYITWGNAVYTNRSNVSITGSASIHGGNAYKGGAVYYDCTDTTGKLDIELDEGGIIDCEALGESNSLWGGSAIYAGNKGAVNIKSGVIKGAAMGNETATGGTVYCHTNSTVNISGGEIWPSTNTPFGATLYANNATVNISGGTLKAGTVADRGSTIAYGGTLYATNSSEVSVTGNAQIEGGSATRGATVYVGGNTKFTLNSANALVGGGTATMGGTMYAVSSSTIDVKNGKIGGGTATGNGGTIYSEGIINVSGGEIEGGTAYNGGTIRLAGSNGSGSLNISGGVIGGGTVTGTDTGSHNGATISSGAAITISGGTVYGGTFENSGSKLGAAVYLSGSDVAFRMTGGTIDASTSTATYGTALYTHIPEASTSEMTGGTIIGGTATSNGGSVLVDSNCHFDVSGTAVIKDGVANVNGGNIHISSNGVLNFSGGTIKDGSTATEIGNTNFGCRGGNISDNGTVNMTGGTIENGTAYGSGGNVYVSNVGIFNISGGTVSGGTANAFTGNGSTRNGWGGGNFLCDGALNISGTAEIINGIATAGGGGNISANGSDSHINMTGGVISGGSSPYAASGNVYIWYRAPQDAFKMSGGTVEVGTNSNADPNSLGGIEIYYSTEGSNTYPKIFEVSGNATINDKVAVYTGSFIKITEFTGTINTLTSDYSSGEVGVEWDADYIASEQVGLHENFEADYIEGTVKLLLKRDLDIADAAEEIIAGMEGDASNITLADRDALLAMDNLSDSAKELLSYRYEMSDEDLEAAVKEAKGYQQMMDIKIKGVDHSDDQYLFAIYSSVDSGNLASYDYANIVITINGITRGNTAEGTDKKTAVYSYITYENEKFIDADDYVYGASATDKSDYIYCTTLTLNKSIADNEAKMAIAVDIYAVLYIDGVGYEGRHFTGTVADLFALVQVAE